MDTQLPAPVHSWPDSARFLLYLLVPWRKLRGVETIEIPKLHVLWREYLNNLKRRGITVRLEEKSLDVILDEAIEFLMAEDVLTHDPWSRTFTLTLPLERAYTIRPINDVHRWDATESAIIGSLTMKYDLLKL